MVKDLTVFSCWVVFKLVLLNKEVKPAFVMDVFNHFESPFSCFQKTLVFVFVSMTDFEVIFYPDPKHKLRL